MFDFTTAFDGFWTAFLGFFNTLWNTIFGGLASFFGGFSA